jgi:hypothetical protein
MVVIMVILATATSFQAQEEAFNVCLPRFFRLQHTATTAANSQPPNLFGVAHSIKFH